MMPATFIFRPMRWRDITPIARWHYPGPYAFYDTSVTPLVAVMFAQTLLRLLGSSVYYTVVDEHGRIVGIFSFLRHGDSSVEVGLGLRPDLTGHSAGLGLAYVQAGLDFARRRFHPKRFTLSVATWNKRAVRVYERAGFVAEKVTIRMKLGRRYEALDMIREE